MWTLQGCGWISSSHHDMPPSSSFFFNLFFLWCPTSFSLDISPSCRESKAHLNLTLPFPGGVSVLGDPAAWELFSLVYFLPVGSVDCGLSDGWLERGGREGKGDFSFHEWGTTWWWQGLGARPIWSNGFFSPNVLINRGYFPSNNPFLFSNLISSLFVVKNFPLLFWTILQNSVRVNDN